MSIQHADIDHTGLPGVGVGGGAAVTVRKTADESVASSTALQNDDELLAAIAANEVWLWEFDIWFQNTGGTGDLKYGITVPSGATVYYSETGLDAGGSNYNDAFVTTTSAGVRTMDTASTNIRHFRVKCMVANGATPGNVQFQWAQNTSNGTATVVKANSCMIGHQLA